MSYICKHYRHKTNIFRHLSYLFHRENALPYTLTGTSTLAGTGKDTKSPGHKVTRPPRHPLDNTYKYTGIVE